MSFLSPTDGSAVDCKHYIGDKGEVHFTSGEHKKDILIPIMNDIDGGVATFTVELSDLQGPWKGAVFGNFEFPRV